MRPIKVVERVIYRANDTQAIVQFLRGAVAKVSMRAMTMSTDTMPENPGLDYFLAEGMRAYTGVYDGSPVQPEYIERLAADAGKTKLSTPVEMADFTFLIQDVTRAWTHQAVRYRVGTAFIQQSMRVFGQGDVYRVLLTKDLDTADRRETYMDGIVDSIRRYDRLVLEGCPAEDARGMLPHHILTAMYWKMSLATLVRVFETRICCQAQQDEWPGIMMQMRDLVRQYAGDNVANLIMAPIERGEDCGFHASIDKPCVWRQRNVKTVTQETLFAGQAENAMDVNPGPSTL